MSSANRLKLEEEKPHRFLMADSDWMEENDYADHPWPSFPVIKKERQIGYAYMKPVHWERLVIRDTTGKLQHILVVISLFWGGLKASGFMEAFPSQSTIAEQVGYDRRTIQRYLQDAYDLGWLQKMKRKPTKKGQIPNNYLLSVPDTALALALYDEQSDRVSHGKTTFQQRIKRIESTKMRHGDARLAAGDRSDSGTVTPGVRQGDALIEQVTPSLNIKKELSVGANAPRVIKKEKSKSKNKSTPSDTAQESPPSAEVLQEEGKKLIHAAQETDTPLDDYQSLSILSRWTPDEVKERILAAQS